jgi:CBS-domain-containing membrane protein
MKRRNFSKELPWGLTTRVRVLVPAGLSATGTARRKTVGIDRALADLVRALQKAGIHMEGSCSGHGRRPGEILLADGRTLLVVFPTVTRETFAWHRNRGA